MEWARAMYTERAKARSGSSRQFDSAEGGDNDMVRYGPKVTVTG